jgi:pimeloyl-ACP methyl ester carboxylesterase
MEADRGVQSVASVNESENMAKNKNPQMIRKAVGGLSYVFPGWSARIAARWFLTPQYLPPHQKEALFLATADKREKVNGCMLWRWGRGPKVIGLHGWSGRGGQFMGFVEPLVQSGMEVILMDAPGHGESDDGPTNLLVFAEALQSIIARETGGGAGSGAGTGAIGGNAIHCVIGHSLGAAAAVFAASLGAPIGHLVLVGMSARVRSSFDGFCRNVGLSAVSRAKFYQAVVAQVGLGPDDVSPVNLAPHLPTPALLLHDPEDEQVSIHHPREMIKLWPAARLVTIPGVGHYRILRDPVAIEEARKFLDVR